MLSNPMLGVAIGLIFMYLLLSIVITVLQEFISSTLKLRNKNLLTAITELVGEANKAEFFKHPLIYPLFRGDIDESTGNPKQGPPAYIPRRNFALAILDLQARDKAKPIAQAQDAGNSKQPGLAPAFALAAFFEDAQSGVGLSNRITKFGATADDLIGKITNPTVKAAATDALTAAVGELKTATDVVDTAVTELQNLFDGTMDRASGWYKVNAQRIAFAIGLLVALVLNVDTIHVGKQLWASDALREKAVAAASAFYDSAEGQAQLNAICIAKESQAEVPAPGTKAAEDAGPSLSEAEWLKVKACTESKVAEVTKTLADVGYPIGWTGWDGYLPKGQPGQNLAWALVGMLLTGLALSLGSSFWFDLLGKFMNVRMTGKREPTGIEPASSLPMK
jgi:tetrahydromethanopterin S-methyltransferase subunit F